MSKSTKSWRCTKQYFNREYSILHQSFFADSKIQVNNTMLILYLKLANTPSIQMITGHLSAIIASILSKFRDLLAEDLNNSIEMIGGDGIEVEINETLISKLLLD